MSYCQKSTLGVSLSQQMPVRISNDIKLKLAKYKIYDYLKLLLKYTFEV